MPMSRIANLHDAARTLVAADERLALFCEGVLESTLPYAPPEPRAFPIIASLPDFRPLANGRTSALTDAVIAAAADLEWRQSYTVEEVGAHFLANYGWFTLVSPAGPYVSPDFQISIGAWREGLYYPRHWHRPEELYYVVAGEALFITDGYPDERLGPEGKRYHPSMVPHAARMETAPLLALAVWKGAGLMEKSTLDPADLAGQNGSP